MLKFFVIMVGSVLMLSLAPAAYSFPQGSFVLTCKHCKMHHGKLSCKCQKANQRYGKRNSLEFANRCNYIENLNGRLVCTGGYRGFFRNHRRGHHRWADVNAGPIFSNNQAQSVCPAVCGGIKRWNGQWQTRGSTSYCQCKLRR